MNNNKTFFLVYEIRYLEINNKKFKMKKMKHKIKNICLNKKLI